MLPNGDDDDDFSDIDDLDIFEIDVPGTAPETEANRSSNTNSRESPRPVKRRRLNSKPSLPKGGEDDSDLESISSPSEDDDLPTTSGERSRRSTSNAAAPSKYKIHISKGGNIQENTFVTQLTQPPSSPSRIRGPRWKKPDPQPPPAQEAPQIRAAGGSEDEDLRAAIAASLRPCPPGPSHSKSSTHSTKPSGPQPAIPRPAPKPPETSNLETLSDIGDGDIPDDLFDSLSFPSANAAAAEDSIVISSQPVANQQIPSQRPSNTQQANLRQTTLFGGLAPTTGTSNSQTVTRSWPLANKNEPPTHHKLDHEAIKTWVYPTNLGTTRDYQFSISHRGLFHNLLVALPTGLGKTFIAATIMLNWFRWTKDAQIVFVAPTKPLVSQQIMACFNIVGIPRSQTTMLTGNTPPGVRAEEWKEKRVFFMTPQTLVNDLKSGIADPKRIVLLVVDEAHRATGGYAYVEVVSFLRRFNTCFRVLALTATPGATVESVQAVIDGLDISRVEIRTEQSLDIREFVHTRNVEIETFENSEEMLMVMELFSKVLQPGVDKLRSLNAHWASDPMTLTPYGLLQARQKWMVSEAGRNADGGFKFSILTTFSTLASLAQAIDLLKYHGITPCFRSLVAFRDSTGDGDKGGKFRRQITDNANFKLLMGRLQTWTNNAEFVGHPKLEYLKSVVLNHFMDAGEGLGSANGRPPSDTRIMIFVQYRDSAEVVTRLLKRHEPMIRPHVFVGQASARGSEGMDQKTQLDIVQKFKNGVYNTIVATSIGEEGLDIGEVDLIVCYDSSASPVRMLQRMGRTGRKRAGKIVLLLMKGKEEESYTKAKDNYEKMQLLIAGGSGFNFHDDKSPRIIPKEVQPVVDKKHIEIPVENTQNELPEPKKRARPPKKPAKKFQMPDGVETGFTKASTLGGKKTKKDNKKDKQDDTKRRPPVVETVDVPSLDEVVLSAAEQRQLELQYCNIGGTTPQFIQRPRNDAYPDLQRFSRPTGLVRHGTVTRRVVRTLRTMHATEPNCENRFKRTLHPEDIQSTEASSGKAPATDRRRNVDPATTDKGPSKRSERVDLTSPRATPIELQDPSSPLMCTQGSLDLHQHLPFFPSQPSAIDDSGLDFDLPGVDDLIRPLIAPSKPSSGRGNGKEPDGPSNTKSNPKRAPKRRRLIIDDDDDSDF